MKMKLHFTIEPDKVSAVLAALSRVGVVNVVVRTEGEPETMSDTNFGKLAQSVLEQQQAPLSRESMMYSRDIQRGPDRKERHYVGGKQDKGIKGYDLCLQIFETLPPETVLSFEQVNEEFMKHEFANGTPSTYLSALVREGKLIRPTMGKYYMPAREEPK